MKTLLKYLILCLPQIIIAQQAPLPSARFLFNNSNAVDDINHRYAALVNTHFVEDRFGNTNNAVLIYGNQDTYINLGSYPALKPKSGSISIWLKMDNPVYWGKGILANPIIRAHNCRCNDFNEAYSLSYDWSTHKFDATTCLDSSEQVIAQSLDIAKQGKWYHLVVTYDNHAMMLYVDGRFQTRFNKRFETRFESSDSVIVGLVLNKKNIRGFRGTVDDIMIFDHMLTQEEVDILYHEPNPDKGKILMMRVIWILIILLATILIYFFVRYRFNIKLKRQKQSFEIANKQLENELRINRALMNPHFVFNSMNTLHHYILTNNTEKASNYLVKFSRLIRKILDSNMSDVISLEQEMELIELYLEMETMRFKDHVGHMIFKDNEVVPSQLIIPIMMLQPFIENAVWHGLREKQGDKLITISFSLYEDVYLQCVIEDNGVGRKKKVENQLDKKSMAINFIQQRLTLLNRIHNLECSLVIIDKENNQGTIIKILLPVLNRLKS